VNRLGWRDTLLKYFRDRQRLSVVKQGNRYTSRRVGNGNIKRLMRSVPNMKYELLMGTCLAKDPARAWHAVTAALQKPRSAVIFHTKNHYVPVLGYVGSKDYEDNLCSLFYARRGQQPDAKQAPVPFSEVCRIIRSKKIYCLMRVYYSS